MARKPASDHPPLGRRRVRVPRHAAHAGRPSRRRTSSPSADDAAAPRAESEHADQAAGTLICHVRTARRAGDRAGEARSRSCPEIYASGDQTAARDAGRRHAELQAGRRGVPRVPRHRDRPRRRARDARRRGRRRDARVPRERDRRRRRPRSPSSTRELRELLVPARSRRRQERDRRDPRRRGRRGGQPLGRRPLPHVRALRRPPPLEGRGARPASRPTWAGSARSRSW